MCRGTFFITCEDKENKGEKRSPECRNAEKGIKIGSNNWFGQEVLMLNKASIPDNCVIGIRSLINKSFSQNNSLIAGSPATTKRNNIGWHEYLDSSYLHTVNPRKQLKG